MATHLGKEGTVQVGSNAIAEIRGFSIDETIDSRRYFNGRFFKNILSFY